jgi:hypothetical protein
VAAIDPLYTLSIMSDDHAADSVPDPIQVPVLARPWLSIPLKDYEGHMSAVDVARLPVLAELFRYVLERWRPESVAVVGIAGGNGLEVIDTSVAKRIVGLDINQRYLDEVKKRFDTLAGLELHRCDLTMQPADVPPAALVHAALLFEHTGLGLTLENVLSLVAPGGIFSVVLQLPSAEAKNVAITKYTSLQLLKRQFALIDVTEFRLEMAARRFQPMHEDKRPLPGGKAFWLGVFVKQA